MYRIGLMGMLVFIDDGADSIVADARTDDQKQEQRSKRDA
jgi:hypothetical protein